MSVELSAEEHLGKFGFSLQQARNFIVANFERPEILFDTFLIGGITTKMLSEITNLSEDVICGYFASLDFDCGLLDETSILINEDGDVTSLENLVGFNENNSGLLSDDSLKEEILSLVFPDERDVFLSPVYLLQDADGIYDAAELGVNGIDSILATDENIESLFYGTLINLFSVLNESELTLLKAFPSDGNAEEYKSLFLNAISGDTVERPEEKIFEYVTEVASTAMINFIGSGHFGRLDFFFDPGNEWLDIQI